ncbi:MAG: LysR family transcriptional regulator [Lachnospiraceae bacterium]
MIKQIKYFQAVVRCKSFTEAAEECFISQSAISQQIQALEQELGVKLLNRGNRKFSLTPAGEYFYRKSLVLIADFERIRNETVRIANKDRAELRIGYLKCYSGQEFRMAVADYSQRYPDVSIQIINGNHEDLYTALRNGEVDLILSDQRRAFSDEYANFILASSKCYIEIAAWNPIASLECVETEELKNIPCILVASPGQQDTEQTYYREVLGIQSDFQFAENIEEARLLVVGGKGFMPIEGGTQELGSAASLSRVLLTRRGNPIKRTYCAFWKEDNSGYYIEAFADILKSKFLPDNKE